MSTVLFLTFLPLYIYTVTYDALVDFLRSSCPASVEVMLGENDILCANDNTNDAQAYIKYSGGLDFSLQGVRAGEKTDTKQYSFRNEHEMVAILQAAVLELLDGERRI